MKRLIPGFLAVLTLASLAACSDNDNNNRPVATGDGFLRDRARRNSCTRTSEMNLPQMINDLLVTDDDTNETAMPEPVPQT